MAGTTLVQAEAHLAAWLAADLAVTNNQGYTIGDRTLTRVNAQHIGAQIIYWNGEVQRLSRTRDRTRYVVPK